VLSPEIAAAGAHISSMMSQLRNYMIRSCKRRCFVFRRLLLLPGDESRFDYLMTLSRHLCALPDQMLAYRLTSQQLTQIGQAVRAVSRCMNQGLVPSDDRHDFDFIVAGVATGLFIFALYSQNIDLMQLLLKLNLKQLKMFPQEIDGLLQAEVINPGQTPYKNPRIVYKYEIISLVPASLATKFVVGDSSQGWLAHFAPALLDFMLIDTFVRSIAELGEAKPKLYVGLLTCLRKVHDIYTELLTFASGAVSIVLVMKKKDRWMNK